LPLSLNVDNVKNFISQLQHTGIDFMTVHGPTLLEENTTKMLACYTEIANIPVIGNCSMDRHDDIRMH
jgi:tRNA-dihydrouridine synthase